VRPQRDGWEEFEDIEGGVLGSSSPGLYRIEGHFACCCCWQRRHLCLHVYNAASLDRRRREFDEEHRCLADVRQLRHRLASNARRYTTATTAAAAAAEPSMSVAAGVS